MAVAAVVERRRRFRTVTSKQASEAAPGSSVRTFDMALGLGVGLVFRV